MTNKELLKKLKLFIILYPHYNLLLTYPCKKCKKFIQGHYTCKNIKTKLYYLKSQKIISKKSEQWGSNGHDHTDWVCVEWLND